MTTGCVGGIFIKSSFAFHPSVGTFAIYRFVLNGEQFSPPLARETAAWHLDSGTAGCAGFGMASVRPPSGAKPRGNRVRG